MLAALALMATLEAVPQQNGTIEISNVRRTHGLLGPIVPPTTNEVMIGDLLVLMWDMKGLKPAKNGTVKYSLGFEIRDGGGDIRLRQKPKEHVKNLTLGGMTSTESYSTTIGSDTEPGEYTVKITVEDMNSKATGDFTYKFKVVKQEFSIVRLFLAYSDIQPNGLYFPAPPVGIVGQKLYLHCYVQAFSRKNGDPSFSVRMRILENGNPTVEAPLEGNFTKKEVPKEAKLFPITLELNLNRAGKFTVELTAKDALTGETAKQTFNLTVNSAN